MIKIALYIDLNLIVFVQFQRCMHPNFLSCDCILIGSWRWLHARNHISVIHNQSEFTNLGRFVECSCKEWIKSIYWSCEYRAIEMISMIVFNFFPRSWTSFLVTLNSWAYPDDTLMCILMYVHVRTVNILTRNAICSESFYILDDSFWSIIHNRCTKYDHWCWIVMRRCLNFIFDGIDCRGNTF